MLARPVNILTSAPPLREGRFSPSPKKDTEAAVRDVQVPEVDPQVIRRHVGLVVGVDRDGVDMVGVGVGEHSARTHLHHQVHGLQDRDLDNMQSNGGDGDAGSRLSLNHLG